MIGKILAAVPLAATACGMALAAPPSEVADQLREIGPRIEIARTAQIYAPLLPDDLYAGTKVTRDLAYGDDDKQKLDVFSSAGPADTAGTMKPVLVFVHGGGFVGGDKHNAGSPLYDNVMAWAATHGMIGVNINYRLAPGHTWPAGADDVALAVDWIAHNIDRFGGDPARIFLWGHSVGATHVADYVAHRQARHSEGTRVRGAILTSGQIYDMTGPNVSTAYFGEDQSSYPAMAALPGLVVSGTPLLITSAELDPAPFKAQTAALEAALAKAGRPVLSAELAGHSHISEIYAIGTADHGLSDMVLAFVRPETANP